MKRAVAATIAGVSLLAGSWIGATMFAPSPAGAQSSAATTAQPLHRFGGLRGGAHGHGDDAAIVAKVIGISTSQLSTELSAGKTIAQVAKAHNVDPAKVIDALTTDKLSKIAAKLKDGSLTQAQADQLKATAKQRATDRVNNPGGLCHFGDRSGSSTTTPTATTSAV